MQNFERRQNSYICIMEEHPDKEKLSKLPVFFIVGRERSGTTLLRTIFDAHPNVNIPVEFHFIWHMFSKYHKCKFWSLKKLEEFYRDLIHLPRYHLLTIKEEKLHSDILSMEGETSYATLCKVVLINYISLFPKQETLLLGDKCPVYSLYLSKLLKAFPDARIIHITRDYRDVAQSMLRVHIETHNFTSITYRWKYYNRQILKVKKKYPDSFLTLRYEDFVTDPSQYLETISSFLNLPYVPETLEFYKKKEDYMKVYPKRVFERVHRNLFKPITNDHIYGWKEKMSERRIRLADSIIGPDAEFWGYERIYKKKDTWQFMFNWPGLLYGRVYYIWGSFVSRLPLGLKVRILFILAFFFKHKWRYIKVNLPADAG